MFSRIINIYYILKFIVGYIILCFLIYVTLVGKIWDLKISPFDLKSAFSTDRKAVSVLYFLFPRFRRIRSVRMLRFRTYYEASDLLNKHFPCEKQRKKGNSRPFEIEKASVSKAVDCSLGLSRLLQDHLGNFIKKLVSMSILWDLQPKFSRWYLDLTSFSNHCFFLIP